MRVPDGTATPNVYGDSRLENDKSGTLAKLSNDLDFSCKESVLFYLADKNHFIKDTRDISNYESKINSIHSTFSLTSNVFIKFRGFLSLFLKILQDITDNDIHRGKSILLRCIVGCTYFFLSAPRNEYELRTPGETYFNYARIITRFRANGDLLATGTIREFLFFSFRAC